jgi:hypothetical protein
LLGDDGSLKAQGSFEEVREMCHDFSDYMQTSEEEETTTQKEHKDDEGRSEQQNDLSEEAATGTLFNIRASFGVRNKLIEVICLNPRIRKLYFYHKI